MRVIYEGGKTVSPAPLFLGFVVRLGILNDLPHVTAHICCFNVLRPAKRRSLRP